MRKKKRKDEDEPRAPENMPPEDFCAWWYPTGTDQPSGAGVGGHPDAARCWARKDPGKWTRRLFGIDAIKAWACQCYRDEFRRWVDADRPEREPFVSIALPLDEQHARYKEIAATIAQIGKPMPKDPLALPPIKQVQGREIVNIKPAAEDNNDDDSPIPF